MPSDLFIHRTRGHMRHNRFRALTLAAFASAASAAATAQQRQMPPAWPYAQTELPAGQIPPHAEAPRTPPVANPGPPAAAPLPLLQAKGSALKFTQQQVSNSYAPADWFPESHPAMPEIV